MKPSKLARQHWAALRALLVLTVILGLAYPVFIWLVAQLPGLHDKATGSLVRVPGNVPQLVTQTPAPGPRAKGQEEARPSP